MLSVLQPFRSLQMQRHFPLSSLTNTDVRLKEFSKSKCQLLRSLTYTGTFAAAVMKAFLQSAIMLSLNCFILKQFVLLINIFTSVDVKELYVWLHTIYTYNS